MNEIVSSNDAWWVWRIMAGNPPTADECEQDAGGSDE